MVFWTPVYKRDCCFWQGRVWNQFCSENWNLINSSADKKAETSLRQGFRIPGKVFIFVGAVVIMAV